MSLCHPKGLHFYRSVNRDLIFCFSLALGCSTTFQGISTSHPLVTLDLALQNSKGIKDVQNKDNCAIDAALYLNKRTWIQLSWRVKYTFGVGKTRNWPYIELKVGALTLALFTV